MGAHRLLGAAHLATLRNERLVVVDDAVPAELIAAAAAECRGMLATGTLRADAEDVCNPLQRCTHLLLGDAQATAGLRDGQPALAACVDRLNSVPLQLLGAGLGLQLRVLQTMMLSCYPPGAHYRRHLDSYAGKDIPRIVTVLLYLVWEPRTAGQLRVRMGAPAAPRDIEPRPGRAVVFMAQEVEHEVLRSVGERFALVLWIWDTKKDRARAVAYV